MKKIIALLAALAALALTAGCKTPAQHAKDCKSLGGIVASFPVYDKMTGNFDHYHYTCTTANGDIVDEWDQK